MASADGDVFLTNDSRFRYQLSVADDDLEAIGDSDAKNRRDYLGYASVGYDKYPWDIWFNYLGVTEDFDPVLGYIPHRDIFEPSLFTRYHVRSAEKWYKEMGVESRTALYENDMARTTLRDYAFEGDVTLQNDMAFSLDYDHDFHDPYDNQRTRTSVTLEKSDYWRTTQMGWAFGTFEETEDDDEPIHSLFVELAYTFR